MSIQALHIQCSVFFYMVSKCALREMRDSGNKVITLTDSQEYAMPSEVAYEAPVLVRIL